MTTERPTVELPAPVLDYLGSQSTITLATASLAGVPRASTFLYVNDGPTFYFWSKPDTTTARHIEQNPTVSFAIDQYASDLGDTKGIQGSGECSVILSGEEIARVADLFGQKFPDLSPGNTMSISFFRVAPIELEFIDNTTEGAGPSRGKFGAEFHRERSYSVFENLPAFDTDTITGQLQATTAEAGQVVAREGGPADKFLILVDGEVELVRGDAVIATLGPGAFFGEMAIMRDVPRSASVRATKSSRLLAMERDTFRDVMAQALGTTAEFDSVIRDRLDPLESGS